MTHERAVNLHGRWALLRFSVVSRLLASPPPPGELAVELERLAETVWQHPVSGEPVHFARSTIERWYYAARSGADPMRVLRRKVRRDRGQQRAVGAALAAVVRGQYAAHPSWSYQLHLDNLAVRVAEDPRLGPLPSYATLRRYLLARDLRKQRRRPGSETEQRATASLKRREVRSYEAEYVGGLWHLDFHHGSRKVLTASGEWVRPLLLAILDDRSRLVCHAQWYLDETAQSLVHGLVQAFLKRGLPRTLLSDNGSAMVARETREGLERLSILQQTTLPYSPHQNGKQEIIWAQVEGRLLAMLEGQPDLTLALLNEATQAWIEMEYQRRVHAETKQTPLARWLDGPAVVRPCPGVDELRLAFTASQTRAQRQTDGTVSLEGVRFEIPTRFRTLRRVELRYASWDLGHVWLMDETAGLPLARLYPLDRQRNAEGLRRPLEAPSPVAAEAPAQTGIAPLLRQLMAQYAATGLPPAYIAQEEDR